MQIQDGIFNTFRAQCLSFVSSSLLLQKQTKKINRVILLGEERFKLKILPLEISWGFLLIKISNFKFCLIFPYCSVLILYKPTRHSHPACTLLCKCIQFSIHLCYRTSKISESLTTIGRKCSEKLSNNKWCSSFSPLRK